MSKQKNLFEETSKFCQKFHGFKSMSKQNKLFEETSKFCQMFHGLLFDPSGCDGLSNEFMCLNKLAQNERGENSSDLINILFEVILVLQKSNNEAYNDLKTQISALKRGKKIDHISRFYWLNHSPFREFHSEMANHVSGFRRY